MAKKIIKAFLCKQKPEVDYHNILYFILLLQYASMLTIDPSVH